MRVRSFLGCFPSLLFVVGFLACNNGTDQALTRSQPWSGHGASAGGDGGAADASVYTWQDAGGIPSGDGAVPVVGDDAGDPGDDAGPVGAPQPPDPALTAAQCGVCHTAIYKQWQQSMHSHALTSPVTIVQTDEDLAGPFDNTASPDPQKFCVNCHSPNVAAVVNQATLPVPVSTQYTDGVSCTTCHQFDGEPQKGSGGFAGNGQGHGYQTGFLPAKTYVGSLDSPVGNSLHTSNSNGQDYNPNPNKLCANCHEVWIDYDHDGVVEKGLDLALQTTWDEYTEYKTLGGRETCVSCHMAVVPGLTRAADGAQIPGQQLTAAPDRQIHDHSFPGVDFALDTPAQQQATEAARTALLQSAAYFTIDRRSVGFDDQGDVVFGVFLANTGTGHDLPSGFAFARQMWIEITVTDDSGQTIFTSGVVQNPTDDLCDGDSLFEFGNPMKRFFQGCPRVDDELTTFQQKLVDLAGFQIDGSDPFDPAGATKAVQIGNETWKQYLHGGVVARQRTFDNFNQANLKPFDEREVTYVVPVGGDGQGLHLQARLLWRQLPPYFLRALASGQPSSQTPQITPLIPNIETTVMATDSIDL
jgi:Cytochrome c554 and c-prime